jgi:macrodomain Ter protein organizer (MatP/YcbG family)
LHGLQNSDFLKIVSILSKQGESATVATHTTTSKRTQQQETVQERQTQQPAAVKVEEWSGDPMLLEGNTWKQTTRAFPGLDDDAYRFNTSKLSVDFFSVTFSNLGFLSAERFCANQTSKL